MIAARIWNLVMSNLIGIRRMCPQCGRFMQRIIAVDESYIRQKTSFGASRGGRGYGGHVGVPVKTQIRITPRYDICKDCNQRIRHRNTKLRLS